MSSSAGRITDIGHAAFACFDLDASLRFYALLGLHAAFRLNRDDGSPWLVYVHVAGDRFLEFFTDGPAPDGERPRSSYMHLCLVVDDLVAVVEDLRGKGVTIDVEPKRGVDANLQAWITDPDGNKIELMQLAPESPQHAVANGREPVIPAAS
jgi:lactoylglutathione lyase